jgi:short-subunit dehydrogenase
MSRSKRGLILNVGSFSGAVPSPMLATYSGTKAFLATFSAALGEEVRQHNIVVEHINTYFVVCSCTCSIAINLRALRYQRCLKFGGPL